MEKTLFMKWCSRYWLFAEFAFAAIMLILLIVNWNTWDTATKFCCTIPIFIAIHVVEEWLLPGGFHYQYNLFYKSANPDRYPLNQKSDMFINFGATIFYSILTFCPINNGLVAMAVFFGFAESMIHTVFGIKMKKTFKEQGKRTIYGPGTLTAYLYFITLGVCGIIYICQSTFDTSCIITLLVCVVITVGVFIVGLEKLFSNPNSVYAHHSAGYFEKYL